MRFLPSSKRVLSTYVIVYVAILYFPVLLLPLFSFKIGRAHV